MRTPRVWPVFSAFVLALVLTLVVATVALVIRAISLGLEPTAVSFDSTALTIGAVTSSSTLVLLALCFGGGLTLERFRLGKARGGMRVNLVALLGTIALAQVLDSMLRLLNLYEVSTLAKFDEALVGIGAARMVLAIIVLGPLTGFAEELFFRGYMQTRLVQRWPIWRAVVITSVCFGILHLDLVHSVVAGILGLWFGFVTERAESIRPAVWAHAGNNSLAVVLSATGLSELGTAVIIPLGLVSVAVFLVCARHIARVQKPAPRTLDLSAEQVSVLT
jgi:membrane protease YdiL (CAAX protease family)